MSYFNTKFRTELIVDASPVGLGSILTQKNLEDNINVVEYASRKLSETESRYNQSEREALAVVWATEHFNHYLIGSEFTVITDHQPLLGIMNKPMSKPNARLHLCLGILMSPVHFGDVYIDCSHSHNYIFGFFHSHSYTLGFYFCSNCSSLLLEVGSL